MEITRSVILDLLPLYQSGEASADTRAIVEEYLRRDPTLQRLIEPPAVEPQPRRRPMPSVPQSNGRGVCFGGATGRWAWRFSSPCCR
jgi:hypothetical protein